MKGIDMRPFACLLALTVLFPAALPAQQLLNGAFEDAGTGWTQFFPDRQSFTDIDGDGDLEAVIAASNIVNQYEGYYMFQDLPPEFVDLDFGVALTADICATNLNEDLRAYAKLEFLDETNQLLYASTLSGEYASDTYASTNQRRVSVALVKQPSALAAELAGVSKTLNDVTAVRATFFVLRFDTNQTATTGFAYFDNASFGLVSRSYDVPFIINGGFEYNDWYWRENPVSMANGWIASDVNSDGDKELLFVASGLTNAFDVRLWIQDLEATALDFSQGVRVVADIGATNLSPQFKVFTKLELYTNSPPTFPPSANVSGEVDPALFATNNDTKIGVSLDFTFDDITNQLASAGTSIDEVRNLRAVLFLLSSANGPADGFGWFDNVRLECDYKDRPDATRLQPAGGDSFNLSFDSKIGSNYRVQQLNHLSDYRWSNLQSSVSGQIGTTTVAATASDPVGFLRTVLDR